MLSATFAAAKNRPCSTSLMPGVDPGERDAEQHVHADRAEDRLGTDHLVAQDAVQDHDRRDQQQHEHHVRRAVVALRSMSAWTASTAPRTRPARSRSGNPARARARCGGRAAGPAQHHRDREALPQGALEQGDDHVGDEDERAAARRCPPLQAVDERARASRIRSRGWRRARRDAGTADAPDR